MAREFTNIDAKRIIDEHCSMLKDLEKASGAVDKYREKVKKSTEEYIAEEVLNILREVPIEEINREKKGFRVKALREYGYNTIADVAAASVHSIASVHGVSENAAYGIKRVANDLVDKTRKGMKIKLSTDSKTKVATQLILALFQYKSSKPVANEGKRLIACNKQNIQYAIEDLQVGTGTFKWIFSSKVKKQQADNAFATLQGLKKDDYFLDGKRCMMMLEDVEHSSNAEAWKDFEQNPVKYFNDIEDINPGVLGNDDTKYGLPDDLAQEIQDECYFPDGLLCELRHYQEWGVKYVLHQGKALLGDEMGLGKTIQAIATMVSLRNTGATHFVVVCPASVISNWHHEIRKKSMLSVIKVHGPGRKAALNDWIKRGGVAITTFETTGYFKLPEDFRFSLMVVDEAHYIKNREAIRSINVRRISESCDRLLFMTGTALENKVDEMVSLIEVLNPKVAKEIKGLEGLYNAPAFREAVVPVYYRRKREDVLTELPDLIENRDWIDLNAIEKDAYEDALLSKNYANIRRVSWHVDDVRKSSKANRLLEIVEEAKEDGRKVIVFSFFLDTISKVMDLLGDQCTEPINGSVSPERRQEIIDEFDKAEAGKVLVAQIQSGGTGLNIQSASVVVLCEPQFKPSIENQAISRAYRMGQTRNVLVHRLLCEDTVEEKLMNKIEEKQALFDAYADKSEAAQESLDIDEQTFKDIINEEIERIKKEKSDS